MMPEAKSVPTPIKYQGESHRLGLPERKGLPPSVRP
jgi:hypothetical protein